MDELSSEDEMIGAWDGDYENPEVSVCCITFNHELYIRDALVGFLSQRTNFPFEILIHDDASSDATADIIREYHSRYPRIVKPIFQYENQYSKGNRPSRINHGRAIGRYIAFCEGDDCWVNPNKLQIQYDALEKNQNLDMSIHAAQRVDYKNGEKSIIGEYRKNDGVVPIEHIIEKKHAQIPTASTFIRKEVLPALNSFRDARPWITVGDIYLHFFGAKRGGAYYIHEVMSIYRCNTSSSWTLSQSKNPEKGYHHAIQRAKSYADLNAMTYGKYAKSFFASTEKEIIRVLRNERHGYLKRVNFYVRYRRSLSFKNKLFFLPLTIIPFALSFAKLIKR